MATSTLTTRDIARIYLESGVCTRTIENYLRGRSAVRDISIRRIVAAMKALDLHEHIPPSTAEPPVRLVKTG